MSQSISTWLQDILPHTPGCTRAVAKRVFMTTCREFFRITTAWREVLTGIGLTSGQDAYTITPTDVTAQLSQVLSLEYKGRPLRKLVARPAGDAYSGTPHSWFLGPAPNQVTLWPTPDATEADVLTARIALTILPTATELPDLAYVHHYDTLLDGVLGKLYSHPAKPYSNATLAQFHLRRFQNGIGVAAGQAKQGYVKGQDWTYPSYDK